MFSAPKKTFHSSDAFRRRLETNFQKRLVHLSSGSTVPLHKSCLWIVVRGMVRLGALTVHVDELMLGLAGPNESFGEPLSNVPAFEAITLSDCDLLCIPIEEIHDSPGLAQDLLSTVMLRQRQATHLLAVVGLAASKNACAVFWSCWLWITDSPVGRDCDCPCDSPIKTWPMP